jgi:hypothetical protein
MAVAKPTKQVEMSVDEWAAKWSQKEIDHHPTLEHDAYHDDKPIEVEQDDEE